MTEIREPDTETLEAVYVVSKHAKRHAERAREEYGEDRLTARTHSLKKQALYDLKTWVINRFLVAGDEHVVDIESHGINGRTYTCITFSDENGEEWSFHVPAGEFRQERLKQATREMYDPGETTGVTDFTATSSAPRSDLSLEDALLHIEAVGGRSANANRHLPSKHIRRGNSREFAGWSYLGDGGQRLGEADS